MISASLWFLAFVVNRLDGNLFVLFTCAYFLCLAQFSRTNVSACLILAYQSFGVVYGDLSTSPLYVYKSIFSGKMQNHQNPDTIFGAFSLIFWTLTLIPLLKYIIIILTTDDNGEGRFY